MKISWRSLDRAGEFKYYLANGGARTLFSPVTAFYNFLFAFLVINRFVQNWTPAGARRAAIYVSRWKLLAEKLSDRTAEQKGPWFPNGRINLFVPLVNAVVCQYF